MGDEQAVNPQPLHEALAAVLANHEREHGAHAEHLCVEVDVRDLRDWQEHARVNYARGWALREELDAARALNEWACGELAAALNARDDARAEREAAHAALGKLVGTDPIVRYGSSQFECHYCWDESALWAIRREEVQHADTCPWAAAAALVAAPVLAPGRGEG